MSVIFAESVAITKSGLIKGFNGDNMNLNSKVLTPQEADNGFKAAGRVKPPYYAVLASGNQQGFAEGAASAFNDYIKEINLNKENSFEIINRYFDDMQTVAENCGMENSNLSVGVICVYEDCVIAAKTGNCHLLRYSAGELFEIALPDNDGDVRGFHFIDTTKNGDMFALIGAECSEDINYVGIINEFNSDSDLKTKVKSFYKILSENAKDKDCSVILIKLESDDANEVVATPVGDVVITEDAYDKESVADEADEDTAEETDDVVRVVNKSGEPDEAASLKKKILDAIPIAILVVIFGITGGLFVATRVSKPASTQENTTVPTTEVVSEEISSIITEEKTTDSDNMVNVGDPEQGGNVVNPETTTQAPETTTQAPETTTQAPETTTQAPETTTQAPETTTQAPETTTESNTTISEPVEDTTTAPETTTAEPETTTQAPENEPVDTPADEPEDVPADDSADEPVEEPEDEPVDEIIDQIVEEPVG